MRLTRLLDDLATKDLAPTIASAESLAKKLRGVAYLVDQVTVVVSSCAPTGGESINEILLNAARKAEGQSRPSLKG